MTPNAADERRCAVRTAGEDPDPIGSAPRFDELVLVELPLPWPREVGEVPELASAVSGFPGQRIVAVVPEVDREPGTRLITRYRRQAGRCCFSGSDLEIASDEVEGVLSGLGRGEEFDGTPSPPELLLCSHGSRDRCCGSMGTRLHHEVRDRWPDVRVRRSSHLGGHRFAPTGMTLPDGHLWAYLDTVVLDAVFDGRGELSSVVGRCRGTPLLEAPFQVLEREALHRFGWDVLRWPVRDAAEAGGRHMLSFGTGEGEVAVSAEVVVRRELPVPPCGIPSESPSKTAPEYATRHLAVTEH